VVYPITREEYEKMTALRRSLTLGPLLALAFLVAACGIPFFQSSGNSTGTSNSSPYSSTQNMATAKPTMAPAQPMATTTKASNYGNSNNNNGNMNAYIHTTTVKINGNMVHVLTTSKGFMLYYFKKDSMLTSNCTGACAQTWPPLLAPRGAMSISASMMLPKQLSVHKTANGEQIFYDGHALYTFASDMQPGRFSGRGIGNAWYLVGLGL
jgi:predicted lipoprotein with Yx(FWY)xxD motif